MLLPESLSLVVVYEMEKSDSCLGSVQVRESPPVSHDASLYFVQLLGEMIGN